MSKYEIMTVLAPGTELKVIEDILKSVFSAKNIEKFEKLERTELAYEIKKHKQGIFVLANVKAEESLIEEFVRRANILKKQILRFLVINLDSERGINKTFKAIKNDKQRFFSSKKTTASTEENKGFTKPFAKKSFSKKSEETDTSKTTEHEKKPRQPRTIKTKEVKESKVASTAKKVEKTAENKE
ncbi:30S ribosomal protein S6 [Mycoplasma sp. 1654_15]|uniref:30S ribosomal protein S6 n=1 Tax=Mycoplasma sp. 1654_15 TaxID=2725994 RepID=UPI0014492798|nr:30S ribosomal protein S6 [Mycoplasma sp. 1654_15]QJB71083.1 30S ribosomal protein S6 [Mycoplasma sp. 1654_15]